MFRVPALLNRVKCGATIASNVFLNQGPRFVRPVTTSAIRFGEEYVAKEEHDVEALFNAESSSRPDSQRRHGRPAASINRIELLGGVADSPLERTTRNGNAYVTFNIFTNVEFRKPDGSFDENVELHNVIVFGHLIQYARKNVQRGSRALVTGRIHYTGGQQEGLSRIPRTATIVADVVQVIAKNERNSAPASE